MELKILLSNLMPPEFCAVGFFKYLRTENTRKKSEHVTALTQMNTKLEGTIFHYIQLRS